MAINLVELGPILFGEVKDLIMYMQGEVATEKKIFANIMLSTEFIFLW